MWNWALYKQPNWYEGQRKWHNVWRKQHGLEVQEHSPLSCTCWSIRTIFLISPLSNVCLQLQLNLFKFLSVPEKEHSARRSRIRRWGCSSVHMPVNKITDGTQHALYNNVQSEYVSDMDLVQHLENCLESVSQLSLKVLELFESKLAKV